MRITLLILVSVFLFTFNSQSQSRNRSYLGLSIGPSFPSGDFARVQLNDSTSGWAKIGVTVQATYSYRLTHNFGLMAMVSYGSNKFDNIRYKDSLNAAHPDTSFSVEGVRNWSGGGIMIGPYLRFPLGKNLSWNVRGLFGFYGGNSPKLTIRPTDMQTEEPLEPYYRESDKAFSYSFMIGTGFKYRLSKYYILLFGDYLNTSLKFENVTGWDINSQPYKTSFKQNISYYSITIGLGYFF